MVQDVYDAAWKILETLNRMGALNANQIHLNTKKLGSNTTLYRALDLLWEEKLITRNQNKTYSINVEQFRPQTQPLSAYNMYEKVVASSDKLMTELRDKLSKHKRILNYTESDKALARKLVTEKPYSDMISNIVNLFKVGAAMEFLINSGAFSKVIERRAISLRRRNEKYASKFLGILKEKEPILWGELIMLINTRLTTNIGPA